MGERIAARAHGVEAGRLGFPGGEDADQPGAVAAGEVPSLAQRDAEAAGAPVAQDLAAVAAQATADGDLGALAAAAERPAILERAGVGQDEAGVAVEK